MPQVLLAGENAGVLTPEGAALLDPTGNLKPGIPVAPPEGDAGTGMCATNSVSARTGNTSAGTSDFAMVVLERPLSKVYPEIQNSLQNPSIQELSYQSTRARWMYLDFIRRHPGYSPTREF